ncbi:hypothetical protein QC764_115630 [Podospora pseudoanserina]|uniref:Uncharacterized protein n=1 Tax=Podospora pseudoanserina TaxID=2609844 RepID=A0ABR0IR89_9PEZI|nr:hypothetical protein QC764_115630 [Podospora pseudoanserina]
MLAHDAIEQLANREREAWAVDGPVEELPAVMVPVIETRLQGTVAGERRGLRRHHRYHPHININTPSEIQEQQMAGDGLPAYTRYTENTPNDASEDYMDEDSEDDSSEPEYPTVLSPPPSYHAEAQRDPPTYNVAIPGIQSERRSELQRQWVSYAEGKRFEHRQNYVSWRTARSSNSASDTSSVTLAGSPSSSPSSFDPLPAVEPPPPPPPPPPSRSLPAVTPLTTRQRARRALAQFPAKLGGSLAKVIMLDKMASWAAKTKHWKKTKRDYVKEVSGERCFFVGAVDRMPDGQAASDSGSTRPATPAVQVVPPRADPVMNVFVPNEGTGFERGRRHEPGSDSAGSSRPGTATGLVRSSSLLERVASLTKRKKGVDGEAGFPIPELGRRPSRRRPGGDLEMVGG